MIARNRMEIYRAFLCNAAVIGQRTVACLCDSAKSVALVHLRRRALNPIEVSRHTIPREYSMGALLIGILLAVLLSPLAAQTKSHPAATPANQETTPTNQETKPFTLPDEPAFDLPDEPALDESAQDPTEGDLRRAQIENQRAQREYYQRRPGLLERLAPWASGLAAFVAFVTLIVNYRSNAQFQRDTKFYEALKRFGDKDSPSVRASATLLLSEMAQRTPTFSFVGRKRTEYLPTVLNQLVVGMLLEQNPVALESIRATFFNLAPYNRHLSGSLLFNQNKSLAANLVDAFADYISMNGVSNLTDITPEAWVVISTTTGFSREAFEGLLLSFNGRYSRDPVSKFDELLKRTASRRPFMDDYEHLSRQKKSDTRLRQVSNLMRSNIQTCSRASFDLLNSETWAARLFLPRSSLRFHSKKPINMHELNAQNAEISGMAIGISLYDSDLRGCVLNVTFADSYMKRTDLRDSKISGHLQRANLQQTDLQGAFLSMVDLQGTYLAGAKVDDHTRMYDTKWWQANFSEEDIVDTELITKFFNFWLEKYKLKEDQAKIEIILTESHSSVRPTLENLFKSYLDETTQ
jgi:uncharacterized protein YjbI with pentapeptide repeats